MAPILDREGWTVSYAEAPTEDLDDPAIRGADLLIVLGGPIGVYQSGDYPFLRPELALLERRLAAGRPTLGICLGAQLMATALGARVYVGPVKEIGWGPVTLTPQGRASSLAPLGEAGAQVLHWHGDTFDLPEGAIRLAGNQNYQNQAFAFGDAALALQFHLEAGGPQLEEWYVGHTMELSASGVSIPALRRETMAVDADVRWRAERIFSDWLRRIGQGLP